MALSIFLIKKKKPSENKVPANFVIIIPMIKSFNNNSHALLKIDFVPGKLITLSDYHGSLKLPCEGPYPFRR